MKEKDFTQTKEQYIGIATELFEKLLKILEKLVDLEEKYFPIIEKDWDKYESEFKPKYFEIISSNCTEKLLKRGYATSINKPSEYVYIKNGYKAIIKMKSESKAIIEMYFKKSIDEKHQFIFIKEDKDYMIDSVKYGYSNESTWHNYHI